MALNIALQSRPSVTFPKDCLYRFSKLLWNYTVAYKKRGSMTNFLSLTKRFHHFAKLGQLQDTTDEISIWIKFRDSPIRTRRKEEEEKKLGAFDVTSPIRFSKRRILYQPLTRTRAKVELVAAGGGMLSEKFIRDHVGLLWLNKDITRELLVKSL